MPACTVTSSDTGRNSRRQYPKSRSDQSGSTDVDSLSETGIRVQAANLPQFPQIWPEQQFRWIRGLSKMI
jgi:hypothetical protein